MFFRLIIKIIFGRPVTKLHYTLLISLQAFNMPLLSWLAGHRSSQYICLTFSKSGEGMILISFEYSYPFDKENLQHIFHFQVHTTQVHGIKLTKNCGKADQ